jgi:hypothetical protein
MFSIAHNMLPAKLSKSRHICIKGLRPVYKTITTDKPHQRARVIGEVRGTVRPMWGP